MGAFLVVTVDGPAGSGKTVCGRRAALELGIDFISSGTYFRAVTFCALKRGIPLTDEAAVEALAEGLHVTFRNDPDDLTVVVGGEDVTRALKTPEVTDQIRLVAENKGVRTALARTMRRRAEARSVLAEGRDMGSVVFPDAPLKFFLEADLECRTARRGAELRLLGSTVDPAALRREIAARDDRDRSRGVSPLVVPEGAVVIDTSALSIEEVVRAIVARVRAHGQTH